MKYLTTLALITLAAPAMAEMRIYDCHLTQTCYGGGMDCNTTDTRYQYHLDAAAGTGYMVQEGAQFAGIVTTSGEAEHFFFTNDAGMEMATIANSEIVFLGNMMVGNGITHYRLTGTCTSGGTPGVAPSK